jgi:hypothetical protein
MSGVECGKDVERLLAPEMLGIIRSEAFPFVLGGTTTPLSSLIWGRDPERATPLIA